MRLGKEYENAINICGNLIVLGFWPPSKPIVPTDILFKCQREPHFPLCTNVVLTTVFKAIVGEKCIAYLAQGGVYLNNYMSGVIDTIYITDYYYDMIINGNCKNNELCVSLNILYKECRMKFHASPTDST
jgi:hypothetical protein